MPEVADNRPLVISLCGTFLKPEMQSIYRQVTGLCRWRTVVYTQSHTNAGMFPFEPVITLKRLPRPRQRGNFILRFWFKYVVQQWPPPIPIKKDVQPYYPYDLVTRLQKDRPDLVHVYYGHKAVHYLDMLEAWGGAWVVSFHGVDVSKFIEMEGYLEKLRRVFAEARMVMARSHSLLSKLESLGCPRGKLRLNRTAIPLEHLSGTVRQPPTDGHWRFVQACRLIQKKGILTTLEALAVVKVRYPKFKYIICGDGPLRNKIAATVTHLGLGDNVELTGWLPQQRLIAEYHRAHLFLHPSEKTRDGDQEGVPNSMLEAMATGLPVVATQHGGIPEAVTQDRDGLLVPEHSAKELAVAILLMMGDASLLSRSSERAAASVRAKFGSEAQIAAMEDVYFEAMKSSRSE
ncbi:MAG TPA: glycosyltransferase [Verrucomicrobiaceae bacterium]